MCPRCGQPLPSQSREGIYLSARQVQIFDHIYKHAGITAEGIAYHCGIRPDCVRVHVNHINNMLVATDTRIKCTRISNDPGLYRVVRRKS
jgi:DNA-binding NarL/FixJ family response regulator